MNCDEIKRFIQDYVTRELDSENRRLFDAHLLECVECQRELAVMTAVVSTLDHQPVMEPSQEFSQKVLAALPRQRTFAPSPWWSLALAPALAGLAFLFRSQLLGWVVETARVVGIRPESIGQLRLPASLSMAQVVLVPAVVVGLSLVLFAGATALSWRLMEQ